MSSNRDRADDVNEHIIEPLTQAIDHSHWLSVHRHSPVAGHLEEILKGCRSMAYDMKGALARGERLHSCEAELKNRPDYSITQGTPAEFRCSCGRVWQHWDEESEGGGWEEVRGEG